MSSDYGIDRVTYSREITRVLCKLKKRDARTFSLLQKQLEKIIQKPHIGKPLRYTLKNRRRVHIGSFVLVYEILDTELRFLDFSS